MLGVLSQERALGVTPGEPAVTWWMGVPNLCVFLGTPAVGPPTHTFLPIVLESLLYGGEYVSGRTLKKKKYLSCLL